MAVEEIICTICGASNPKDAERCRSCGAKSVQVSQELSDEELYARRHQQDTFEWKWVFLSFVVFLVLSAIALWLLPAVISTYDPQGFAGIVIIIGIWFVGAAVINFIAPKKAFLEPPVGGLLASFPTLVYLSSIADVYQLSMLAYTFGGAMAVMMALMGAFVGNKLKGDDATVVEPKSRRRAAAR